MTYRSHRRLRARRGESIVAQRYFLSDSTSK